MEVIKTELTTLPGLVATSLISSADSAGETWRARDHGEGRRMISPAKALTAHDPGTHLPKTQ